MRTFVAASTVDAPLSRVWEGVPREESRSEAAAEATNNFSASRSSFFTCLLDLRSIRRWAVISSEVRSAPEWNRLACGDREPLGAVLTLCPALQFSYRILDPPLPTRFGSTESTFAKEPSSPEQDHIILVLYPHGVCYMIVDCLDLRWTEGQERD